MSKVRRHTYLYNSIDCCIVQAGDGCPGVEDYAVFIGCGVEGEVGRGDSQIHSVHGDRRQGDVVEGRIDGVSEEPRLCQSVPTDGRSIKGAKEKGRGFVGL